MQVKSDTELRYDNRLTIMSEGMASAASLATRPFFDSWLGMSFRSGGTISWNGDGRYAREHGFWDT